MSEGLITIYVTKYALSKGILELQAERITNKVAVVKMHGLYHYFHGEDWHTDRDLAVLRAREMREKKIKALEKQTGKLKMMDFV